MTTTLTSEAAAAGAGGGGLFDGINDGGTGGAGDCCAGITAGIMALMLASWQMRFSVGMDEVLNLWLL